MKSERLFGFSWKPALAVDFDDAGHWRSWLARFHGMEEVNGSNPLCSTILQLKNRHLGACFCVYR